MAEQLTIDVPDRVRVRCPLVKFRLRAVKVCVGCELYRGLQEQIGNDQLPVAQRFTVRCAYPTDRDLFELDES